MLAAASQVREEMPGSIQLIILRNCSKAATIPGLRIASVFPSTKALRKRSMALPISTISNVVASVQSALACAIGIRSAAFSFSQSELNSAQVLGKSLIPALSNAFGLDHIQLMRWIFIGTATHEPLGFNTGRSSGATSWSQFSCLAISSRLSVILVASHSAISGPFNCTAGGGLPATTSARSLARVFAVWPAMEVACHLPPAAVYISPSLAIASASDPSLHCERKFVLGSACATTAENSPSFNEIIATAAVVQCAKFIAFSLFKRSDFLGVAV